MLLASCRVANCHRPDIAFKTVWLWKTDHFTGRSDLERFRRPQAKPSPSPDLIRLTFQAIDESEDDDGGDWDWNCSFGERELRESVCVWEREREREEVRVFWMMYNCFLYVVPLPPHPPSPHSSRSLRLSVQLTFSRHQSIEFSELRSHWFCDFRGIRHLLRSNHSSKIAL